MSKELYLQYQVIDRITDYRQIPQKKYATIAGKQVETLYYSTQADSIWNIDQLIGMKFGVPEHFDDGNSGIGAKFWSVFPITVPDNYEIPQKYLTSDPTKQSILAALITDPVSNAVAYTISVAIQSEIVKTPGNSLWGDALVKNLTSNGISALSGYGIYDTLRKFVTSGIDNIDKLTSGKITLDQYEKNVANINDNLVISLADSMIPLPIFNALKNLDSANFAGLNKFSPESYAAQNPDLYRAFGTNDGALVRHYLNSGKAENRNYLGFDAYAYAAQNPDLYRAFGTDKNALIAHYVSRGKAEGRVALGFDPYAYAALNPDLYNAFGTNTNALVGHYISAGKAEGRLVMGFDPYAYAALNSDLYNTFGTNVSALTSHYIKFGKSEGRAASGFDPYSYATSNPDVYSSLGLNVNSLVRHYATSGKNEGRQTEFSVNDSRDGAAISVTGSEFIYATDVFMSGKNKISVVNNLMRGETYQVDALGSSTGQGNVGSFMIDVTSQASSSFHRQTNEGGIGSNSRLQFIAPENGYYTTTITTPSTSGHFVLTILHI